MNTQKFEEIEHLLEDYSMIPICKEIYADVIKPISLLRKKPGIKSKCKDDRC